VTRRPWQRSKGWSPEETAVELHRRREVFAAELRRKPCAQGVPPAAQEEILSDAMTAVVMDARPIMSEQHLLGALWTAVEFRARRYHEGRHLTRLGRRQRVELDASVEGACAQEGAAEQIECVERMRRAADWFAELDERERRVVAVMAGYDVGPLPASRLLGLPLGEVQAASRSARAKLDRVAVIAAAGRMCSYRYAAIEAEATGRAGTREGMAARAHVAACVPCRRVYRQLRREMGREWQRRAVAALAPAPTVNVGHLGWLGKVSAWAYQRPGLPRGSSERAAEIAGGAGIAKAAAAGTALVVAGSALSGHIVHAIEGGHRPSAHHRRHSVRAAQSAYQPVEFTKAWQNTVGPSASAVHVLHSASGSGRRRGAAQRRLPKPPSKSLGYLALGTPAATPSATGSPEPIARAASAPSATASSSGTPKPSQGGGSNLKYLGQ
jgi:hypothetical protein